MYARRAGRRAGRRAARRTMRRMRRRRVMIGGMVLLAAGGTAAAIKLSQKDAQRIEEHTGAAVEELEDNELQQAMQELNIQSQPITAEDQAALGGAAPETPAPAQPTTGTPSYIEELQQLAQLRDQGIITADEFEAKKKQLLDL